MSLSYEKEMLLRMKNGSQRIRESLNTVINMFDKNGINILDNVGLFGEIKRSIIQDDNMIQEMLQDELEVIENGVPDNYRLNEEKVHFVYETAFKRVDQIEAMFTLLNLFGVGILPKRTDIPSSGCVCDFVSIVLDESKRQIAACLYMHLLDLGEFDLWVQEDRDPDWTILDDDFIWASIEHKDETFQNLLWDAMRQRDAEKKTTFNKKYASNAFNSIRIGCL